MRNVSTRPARIPQTLPFLIDVVRMNQVGMIERHGSPRLREKLLKPGGIGGEIAGDQFDRDAFSQLHVLGKELTADPADADLIEQAVLAQAELAEAVEQLRGLPPGDQRPGNQLPRKGS